MWQFWLNVNWTKSDIYLSKIYCCPYQTIRNWRKKLGKLPIYQQKLNVWKQWDWSLSTKELSEKYKIKNYTIRRIRAKVLYDKKLQEKVES